MQINELLLENFQIHKELLLQFSPGVNTLVGESDAGKSAVVRALDLVLRNQPRGGEENFQSDFTETPLKIIISDDQGNLVERSERTYKINDGKPIKAFGATVPDQIVDLFPVKDINFQFQLDPYFMVLETGGKAAEVLNKATGFSDQEMIISEIKSRTAESRKLLKTLIKQKEKSSEEVDKLRNIPRFLMRSKAVALAQSEYDENLRNMHILEESVEDLSRAEDEIKKYVNLDTYKEKLEKICGEEFKVKEILNNKTLIGIKSVRLLELKNKLESLKKLDKFLSPVNEIIAKVKEHNEIREARQDLFSKKNDIDTLNAKWMRQEMIIDDLKLKLTDALKELGKCPLCGSDLKGKIK
jgi:DNA repair protein SbcC/Rad50